MKSSISITYEDAVSVLNTLNKYGNSVDWKMTDEQSEAYEEISRCVDCAYNLTGRETQAMINLHLEVAAAIKWMVQHAPR